MVKGNIPGGLDRVYTRGKGTPGRTSTQEDGDRRRETTTPTPTLHQHHDDEGLSRP